MNGFDYWKLELQKYNVFEGRSGRSEEHPVKKGSKTRLNSRMKSP